MRLLKATFVSAGLALALAIALVPLALHFGILFSGVDTVFVVLVITIFCAFAILVTAAIFKRKGKSFSWRLLFVEVIFLTLIGGGLLAWSQTRQFMKIIMEPMPVPNGLHVKQGRQLLFTGFVHFTASPSDIATIIEAKKLIEVPAEIPDEGVKDLSGFSARANSENSWNWWQPTNMPNSKFFYRHHESEAVQGWSEGWWVNGATNEVYAFIGG
jgi:hypothetical protein